ncbi:hypothetical protein WN944_020716 [Citrus x changshan-huyou]|uniref:Uncharacterized protein n=1 Tax=Citrus x changshan-huyou TaxID=2935761 RepID=A0AAP0M0T9_9ROSI
MAKKKLGCFKEKKAEANLPSNQDEERTDGRDEAATGRLRWRSRNLIKVLCGVFPGESAKDELKKQIYGAGLTYISVSYSQFFKTMITFCRILKI